MVGPSLSESEYATGMSKVQLSVVGLVAASAALVALYGDAPPAVVAIAAVVGALLGYGMWRYLVWSYREQTASDRERPETGTEKRERFK
jgi:hypothetical protein